MCVEGEGLMSFRYSEPDDSPINIVVYYILIMCVGCFGVFLRDFCEKNV